MSGRTWDGFVGFVAAGVVGCEGGTHGCGSLMLVGELYEWWLLVRTE